MDHRSMNVAERERLRNALRVREQENGMVYGNPVFIGRDTSFTDEQPDTGVIDAIQSVPVHY